MTRPPLPRAAEATARGVEVRRLVDEADIAVFIGVTAADDRHVDLERTVAEIGLAIEIDQFDKVILGGTIATPALLARVDEGAEADRGDEARGRRAPISRKSRLMAPLGRQ